MLWLGGNVSSDKVLLTGSIFNLVLEELADFDAEQFKFIKDAIIVIKQQ
tara:strand:+ start:269 stop:415 length:147 start_codon:yes stop_codon:yes gene_type:complete